MANPLLRYWIPADMRPLAAEVHYAIARAAQEHAVPAGDVAQAFLEFAWEQWQQGRLTLAPRANPNPKGRKMRVTLLWKVRPHNNPRNRTRNAPTLQQTTREQVWLGYRMPDADKWRARVSRLAEDGALPEGAVFVYFLAHAAQAYKDGYLALYTFPKEIVQILDAWELNLNFAPEQAA